MPQATFKEQFDRLTIAYLRNEIKPMNPCQCWITSLLNGDAVWNCYRDFKINKVTYDKAGNLKVKTDVTSGFVSLRDARQDECANQYISKAANYPYTIHKIVALEKNFLTVWCNGGRTEDSLFDAMDSTLDMLKQIHIANGEIVDDYEFKKRPQGKIITRFEHPPIPVRDQDWMACFKHDYDNCDYDKKMPEGRGATELEAINNLIENFDEED